VADRFEATTAALAAGGDDFASGFSFTVRDLRSDEVMASYNGDVERPIASVGKLLLLLEVAEQLESDPSLAQRELSRASVEPVGDSGLWQHLHIDVLPLLDVAMLVGTVSDNLATNVLLELVTLSAVESRTVSLGLEQTRLADIVRDERGANEPPLLASGTTNELARLMAYMAREEHRPSAQVLDWIACGMDLSMVGSAFGLDPLSHGVDADRGVRIWSKTGTDTGVRADVGIVAREGLRLSYAAAATWSPHSDADRERDQVLNLMNCLGQDLRQILEVPGSQS
jgi:beta-lactamase class A